MRHRLSKLKNQAVKNIRLINGIQGSLIITEEDFDKGQFPWDTFPIWQTSQSTSSDCLRNNACKSSQTKINRSFL